MKPLAIAAASLVALLVEAAIPADCPKYDDYAARRHPPYSPGSFQYPSQRPDVRCRTYLVPEVEETIEGVRGQIADADLHRLFANTWPNTVDTTILWHGVSAENADQELAFVSTGDIHAMWLRDSANQLQSYKPILASSSAMAHLYRGAINLQARYISRFPYCNAFQPPPESQLAPSFARRSLAPRAAPDVHPPYDPNVVFECKYELDSLAAFLQLSWDYYDATGDALFFARFAWADAVREALKVARAMMEGTYAPDGRLNKSPYTWINQATSATETVSNSGTGNPTVGNIGLVRSFFRPSDDSTIYQHFIPANMMFSRFLSNCVPIMQPIDAQTASDMATMAAAIDKAVREFAVVPHPKYGDIYAFEIDGFGSSNLMDDANIPSLLSIPHLGFRPVSDPIYRRTRDFVLSRSNPYYGVGPVLNATGGPHLGPGMAWPMGVITQALTSDDDNEITACIKQLMGATSGLGLIHESVNTHDQTRWTRSWFAWANGLFGQLLLHLLNEKPALLQQSFQS
ncbi:hypothetical protein CDD81_3376 [Ophiocordyceps australis]|uniref:Glycoside hydrolase family 125 protein n=1 Tax=Ophiocordyceps australis TaxID=1399860 RepID=A0A2C5XV57_9HYPO|nr:hypothetical protein CDD81_3376 [Ophiocordyceps australis]